MNNPHLSAETPPTAITPDNPAPATPSWAEQDAQLRDLWLAGKTPPEIASILGRSVAALMTRAARLALPRRALAGRKPQPRPHSILAPNANASPPVIADNIAQDDNSATPPAAPPLTTTVTLRRCLMCLRNFPSFGVHNRICLPCKDSTAYQDAARLPDIDLPL